MPESFGELLRRYTERTGIGDSELARTLGVSRQTVFRWKEGDVARPRHRDQVLLAGPRLRLTREELDELLLAAGFAPESGDATGPPVQPRPAAPAPLPPVGRPRPRSSRRHAAILAGAAVVAGLALAAAALHGAGSRGALPRARPGEMLIVVAATEAPAAGASTPIGGAADDLHKALAREVAGLHLEGVRVVRWPVAVPTSADARTVRDRSSAAQVLWLGDSADELVLLSLSAADGEGALALGPAGKAALGSGALWALARFVGEQGDADLAAALLVQAVQRSGAEGPTRSALLGLLPGAPAP